MTHVVRIIFPVCGLRSAYDGQYLTEYVPGVVDRNWKYTGLVIRTTESPQQAKKFSDGGKAFQYCQQVGGTRPDGKPNRPLTAWHLEIINVDVIAL